MNRHGIFGNNASGFAMLSSAAAPAPAGGGDVVVVRNEPGRLHGGKVFAAISTFQLKDEPGGDAGITGTK